MMGAFGFHHRRCCRSRRLRKQSRGTFQTVPPGYGMAMENCGFSSDDIRRMMAELHELFDFVSLEEAEAHYQKSLF